MGRRRSGGCQAAAGSVTYRFSYAPSSRPAAAGPAAHFGTQRRRHYMRDGALGIKGRWYRGGGPGNWGIHFLRVHFNIHLDNH